MFRFVKVVRTRLASNVRALLLQTRGLGSTGNDDAAEALDDVELLQPLGLMARPSIRDSLEALVVELGEEVVALFVGDKSRSAIELEDGEARLYGPAESTCRIRMRADGSIDIEAKSATDIRLNGGTLKVARVTDPTTGHTHSVTHVLTAPPGGGPVTGSITIASATDTIASSAGADRVKA